VDKRGALIGVGVAVLVALVAAVVWFGPLDGGSSDADDRPGIDTGDPAAEAADAFAAAWAAGTLGEVPVTPSSGVIADRSVATSAGLGLEGGKVPASVEVIELARVEPEAAGEGEVDDAAGGDVPERVRATLDVRWQLDETRTWSYETAVELVEAPAPAAEGEGDDGEPVWLVDWTQAVVHPQVGEGERLVTVRQTGARGEVLDLAGEPIVGLRPVVVIGITPGATTDRGATARQVAGLVGVDADSLAERVEGAGADALVSVVTLRKEAFDAVAGSLEGIPGVVLEETELPLAPSRDFARALLGSAGPATQEIADASGGTISVGDTVGLSGLQAAQDDVLGGQPGLSVRVDRTANDLPATVLKEFPAVDGTDVTITLDARLQVAAEEALAAAPGPAALVAIRPSNGDILAVANGPAGADGFNRAMVGRYPPGSTFKVASTFAFLQAGLTPETIVPCPATIVAGKEFRNAGGFVLGDVPFRTDFARSCNTAFVSQYDDITSQQLADAASSLGFRPLDLGVPVLSGTVPVTDSDAEHASDLIGQGKVEASPLVVALMSASVAAGRSIEPRLLVDPASPEPAAAPELPVEAITDLRELMRAVVTEGTGEAVANVPGGEVHGKSGTAEYGTESPPATHAWFTGYQGDVAFAVLVEGGSSGGGVAAPLAASFLTAIAE
jgi:cell division protein FtsI/penicillin-binding protein 2